MNVNAVEISTSSKKHTLGLGNEVALPAAGVSRGGGAVSSACGAVGEGGCGAAWSRAPAGQGATQTAAAR